MIQKERKKNESHILLLTTDHIEITGPKIIALHFILVLQINTYTIKYV